MQFIVEALGSTPTIKKKKINGKIPSVWSETMLEKISTMLEKISTSEFGRIKKCFASRAQRCTPAGPATWEAEAEAETRFSPGHPDSSEISSQKIN